MRRRRSVVSSDGLADGLPEGGARCALVVVGAQVGWLERASDGERIVRTMRDRVPVLAASGVPVMTVVHRRVSWRAARRGAPPEDSTSLDVGVLTDRIVDAAGHDAFFGGRLDAELRAAGASQILLAGFAAESTVESTARSAVERGYRCRIVTDLVAVLREPLGRRRLEAMADLDVELVGSNALLDELTERSVRR